MKNTIDHYDKLIEENNDPVYDPEPLRDYMDSWDGDRFFESMMLSKSKSVLEIGVGTGRLAIKAAPKCKNFWGIDISPKTVKRARENLSLYSNVKLICGDFTTHEFDRRFDVIYSSLTFMHIKNKDDAINKVASLLCDDGIFVLSIDKNQSDFIDMGTRKIQIYPDDPIKICNCISEANLIIIDRYDTKNAYITVSKKVSHE